VFAELFMHFETIFRIRHFFIQNAVIYLKYAPIQGLRSPFGNEWAYVSL